MDDASLGVTAQFVQGFGPTEYLFSLGVQPVDDETATLSLLSDPTHIADVKTVPVNVRTSSSYIEASHFFACIPLSFCLCWVIHLPS